jgi:outer membrane lipoprotein carrier protein
MMHYIMLALAADGGTAAGDTQALVDRVQAFYEKTTDFTSDFKQDYTYKAFKRTVTSTGKITYKRAARGPQMRWEYEKPEPKSFVLADEKVRLYDPQAMTLTISPMATDKLSASVTFLWGQGKLANEFAITRKDCPTCKGTLLELNPLKPDPRFKQVRLEVDPKTAEVLKSTVVDPDGSENAITFANLKTNSGVEDAAFQIKVAKDTQTVDMTRVMAPAKAPAKDGGSL